VFKGPVPFDLCQLDDFSSFDAPNGMFKATSDGLYSFSAMALMKSDHNAGVMMAIVKLDANGLKVDLLYK